MSLLLKSLILYINIFRFYNSGMKIKSLFLAVFTLVVLFFFAEPLIFSQSHSSLPKPAVVLHAARLLDIEAGKIIAPGEILVQDERIAEVGSSVERPAGARVIDLSADFRIRDPEIYREFYGHEHGAPNLLNGAVYGLLLSYPGTSGAVLTRASSSES